MIPVRLLSKCLDQNFILGMASATRLIDGSQRSYSMYPTRYIEPIYRSADVKNLTEEDVKKLAIQPIKAAKTDQIASLFHDPLIAKFTNLVMRGGDKVTARRIINQAFQKIKVTQVRKYHLTTDEEAKKEIKTFPIAIFQEAIKNTKPLLSVMNVKKGGSVFKVPVPIQDHRSTWQAMKWIIEAARDHPPRRSHTNEFFSDRLAKELLSAAQQSGNAWKKKVELHKLCEANRTYAHYRWL